MSRKLVFEIEPEQVAKAEKFVAAEGEKALVRQRAECEDCDSEAGSWCIRHDSGPYYGAIGGAVTYEFTPTGIGTIVQVRYAGTGAEMNLTDFDDW